MNAPITMTTHAENYLSERRQLGFDLRSPGYSIISFAHYIVRGRKLYKPYKFNML